MSNKIENRLVFFNKESSFNDRLQRQEIQPQSLVFIKDKKKIWTQNQEFSFDPSDDPTIQQIRQDVDVNTTNINNLMGTAIHADEEDTTSVDGALKFADKQYDGASFSGYGRKYLRKNLQVVDFVKHKIYGKKMPFDGFVSDITVSLNEYPLDKEDELKIYYNNDTDGFVFKSNDTYYALPPNYKYVEDLTHPERSMAYYFDGFAPAEYELTDYDNPAATQQEINMLNQEYKILWSRENHTFVFHNEGNGEYVDIKYCTIDAYKNPNTPNLNGTVIVPGAADPQPFYGATYMFYTNAADSRYNVYDYVYYYMDPADETNTLIQYDYCLYTGNWKTDPTVFVCDDQWYIWKMYQVDQLNPSTQNARPGIVWPDQDDEDDEDQPTSGNDQNVLFSTYKLASAEGNIINYLSANMLMNSNTIYYIQYDYDLNGNGVGVGENSILFFVGGSLCNGLIQGDNSTLMGDVRTTSSDIEGVGHFTGTWRNFGSITPTDNIYEGKPFLHEWYNKMIYFRTDNGGADRVWMDGMGYSPMIKAGDTRPQVPTQTSIDNTGYQFFDKQQNRPVWWNGFEWVDCSGRKAHKHIGTTAERPADLDSADYGYEYFDTTIGKNIYWIGDREWVDEEGFTTGIHKGTYNEALALRDSLTLDDVGYKYYATDLNKDIYLTNNYESNVFEFDGFVDVAAQDIQPSSVNTYIDPAEIENDPTNFRVLFNNTTGKFICFYIDAYYSNWRYTNSDKYINPQNNYAYLYDDQYYTVTHGQVVDTLFETPISNLLEWKDSYGFTPAMNKGTTEQGEFVLFGLDKTKDAGFEFFNTTLNRQFYAAMRNLSFRKPLSVKNIGGEDIYAYYFSKKEIDYIFSRTEGFTATLESSMEGTIKVLSYDDQNQQYEQIYGTNQYPFDSDTIVFDEGTMVDMIGESNTIDGPAYADLNYDYVAIIPDQSVIVPNQIVNPDFEVLQYVADPDSILDWVDKNGRLAGKIGGYDSQMPVGLNSTTDVGYEYFLIDLDKPFYWDGERWVDGNDVVYYQNEN